MDWKKMAPWNWFKHEETIPVANSSGFEPPFDSPNPTSFEDSFDELVRHLFTRRGEMARPRRSNRTLTRPALDISEGPKSYCIRVDLPGVEREDVSVTIEGETLAVSAHRQNESDQEEQGYHWIETSRGSMQRLLTLPNDADPESIRASFRNGVLDLRIGKHPERVRPTQEIEIHGY